MYSSYYNDLEELNFDYIYFNQNDKEYLPIGQYLHISRFYVDDKMTYQLTTALIFAEYSGDPIFNEKGENLNYNF